MARLDQLGPARWFIGRAARAVEKAPAVPLSEDDFQTA